jgi:hypothetical protein
LFKIFDREYEIFVKKDWNPKDAIEFFIRLTESSENDSSERFFRMLLHVLSCVFLTLYP